MTEQEELPQKKRDRLYEGKLSCTVLWERKGETPLRDPTIVDSAYHSIARTMITSLADHCAMRRKNKSDPEKARKIYGEAIAFISTYVPH